MNPIHVALAVARALEGVGAGYFLGGSMASSFQGHPRTTQDIDFVVDLAPGRVGAFAEKLGPDFDVDQPALTEALAQRGSWNIFHTPTVTRVDLFALRQSDFDREEFRRRRPFLAAPGESLIIKSPEDTVIRKLLWFREGGEVSSHQLRDVVDVLRVQGQALDEAYLASWVRSLGLEALMRRARELASPGSP